MPDSFENIYRFLERYSADKECFNLDPFNMFNVLGSEFCYEGVILNLILQFNKMVIRSNHPETRTLNRFGQ